MKAKTSQVLWCAVLVFLFFSCGKNNGIYSTEVTQTYDAALRVVAHLKWLNPKTGNLDDSLLTGVSVSIYASETSRDDNEIPVAIKTTDTSGVASFNDLTEDQYFIRASVSPYGLQQDNVTTPDRTTSWVNVDFFKY
jgi:hypothetical protein